MRFGALRLNWIQECRHTGGSAETEQHKSEVKREDEMCCHHQHAGKTSSAQIRHERLRALSKRQRRVALVESLDESAGEKHQYHQSDSVHRRPEVKLDERRITPLATHKARH